MIALLGPLLSFGIVGASVLATVAGRRLVDCRPTRRSSARERLVRRNPWLAGRDQTDQLRWSVTACRVRIDRLTIAVVTVALFLSTLRPTVTASTTDDRR